MVNNNKNDKNNPNVFTEDREFITVRLTTGEQFRKIATLRSENGPITEEQVERFGDEAEKEALKWWKNHPGESVTIRVLENEAGGQKQIVEVTPKSDFLGFGDFRVRIYDPKTGERIVGDENIRKETERREDLWVQWKEEGKLEKVNHEIHHTDDGSIVQIYTMLPPADAEKLHPNEINDETKWAPITGGKLKIESGKEGQQVDENKASGGNSKEEKISENIRGENVAEEEKNQTTGKSDENIQNVKDRSIVEKIKKDISEWKVKRIDFTLSSGAKGSRDCLVHSSAKVNISELGTLIYPVEIFTDSEREELSDVLNDSLLINFVTSGKISQDSLNKNSYQSISLANSSTSGNNTQQTDKAKKPLIVSGVVLVLLMTGLVVVKSRFSKRVRKSKS